MIFRHRTTRVGFKSLRRGLQLLEKENKTAEETAAAGAFRRIMTGILILVAAMFTSLCIVLVWFDPVLNGGSRRYGTVVKSHKVRYVEETNQYAGFGDLGLEGYALEEGDRVILFFNSRTDEFEAAYPQDWYDQYTETRVGIIIGTVMMWITLLLLYAVICRITPFGMAWFQYSRSSLQLKKESPADMTPGARAAAYVFIVIMMLITCWPQFAGLMENLAEMREIGAFGEILPELTKETENAEE